MEKTYVKLLEIGEHDGFYDADFDFLGKVRNHLVGRVFEVTDGGRNDEEWSAFEGWLVGDTLGDWDDGHYIFCEVKVEVVSNPTLIQST